VPNLISIIKVEWIPATKSKQFLEVFKLIDMHYRIRPSRVQKFRLLIINFWDILIIPIDISQAELDLRCGYPLFKIEGIRIPKLNRFSIGCSHYHIIVLYVICKQLCPFCLIYGINKL